MVLGSSQNSINGRLAYKDWALHIRLDPIYRNNRLGITSSTDDSPCHEQYETIAWHDFRQ